MNTLANARGSDPICCLQLDRKGAPLVQIEAADRRLLDSIAETMVEAARRSGDWLVCKPGCTQCCIGPFGITQLDALRLRAGIAGLQKVDAARAAAVRKRAVEYIALIAPQYPGNLESGELYAEDRLPESMDNVPCPALDPATGCCDLYDARPVTCRAFGPVTHIGEESVGACELCYQGASDEEMAACAVKVDADGLEAQLLAALAEEGRTGATIVAFAVKE